MPLLQFTFTLPILTIFLQTPNQSGTPIGVILILLLLVVALYWWGLNRPSYDQIASADEHHAVEPHPAADSHHGPDAHDQVAAESALATPDDLQRIEGIGPAIEKILNAAGIHTFGQLAAAEVDQLERIVREEAGLRIAYPDSWPQQAQLAATGDWNALAKLQEELSGGRVKS